MNLEKAPVPNPKAPEAPDVGEATEVVEGDMALKGFLLLCADVSPVLLPALKLCFVSFVGRGLVEEDVPVDRESLLVL